MRECTSESYLPEDGSEKAADHIKRQIEEAVAFLPDTVDGNTYLDANTYGGLLRAAKVWKDYTGELLRRIFTTDEFAHEFDLAGRLQTSSRRTTGYDLEHIVSTIQRQVFTLISIRKRLEIIDTLPANSATPQESAVSPKQSISAPGFLPRADRGSSSAIAVQT